MGKKKLQKSFNLQDKIIDVSVKILREKGNITLQDIAEGAQVNIASVNYHFKDKINFNKVLIGHVFDDAIEWVKAIEAVKTCTSYADVVKIIVETTVEFLRLNIGIIKYAFAAKSLDAKSSDDNLSIMQLFIHRFDELQAVVMKHLTNFTDADKDLLKIKFSIVFSGFILPAMFALSNKVNDENLASYCFNVEQYVSEFKKVMLI